MKKLFLSYYKGTILNPLTTFKALIQDNRQTLLSIFAVSITAVLYTFVYIFLIFGGGQPFKPWLDIPLEDYYKYNVFFCAPSMFIGWILAAGMVHLVSRQITSTGTFKQTLSVFGFGIGIASWSTGIHDLLSSFLGAIHVISQRDYEIELNSPTVWRAALWIQMIAYLIWFIVLFSKGTKAVYGIKTIQATLLGFLGFVVYQLFFLVFNR